MSEKYKEMGAAADGMKTPSDALAEAKPAWEQLRKDSGLTWVWCTLEGTVYRVASTGEDMGDALFREASAAAATRSDCIWFGGVRVNKPNVKFFHVLYVPTGVSPLKRGKAQLQKSAIFNSWPGASGEVSLTEMDADTLRQGIAKASRCEANDLA